jgi:hypothetical protein
MSALNDRDVQDSIIRYLSDSQVRSEPSYAFLDSEEAHRAQRFSRFLARRYYRDRLARGFHYSAALVGKHRSAEQVADSAEFDPILDRCVLGSLTCSKKVGDLSVSRLLPLRSNAWWYELLEYERAFFLQLATSEATSAGTIPKRNTSAMIREFRVQIPELLASLRLGNGSPHVSYTRVTLLFSRTTHGKVYVVEPDEKTSAVFRSVDGKSSQQQVASTAAVPQEEIHRIFTSLSDIGSVVLPTSA